MNVHKPCIIILLYVYIYIYMLHIYRKSAYECIFNINPLPQDRMTTILLCESGKMNLLVFSFYNVHIMTLLPYCTIVRVMHELFLQKAENLRLLPLARSDVYIVATSNNNCGPTQALLDNNIRLVFTLSCMLYQKVLSVLSSAKCHILLLVTTASPVSV